MKTARYVTVLGGVAAVSLLAASAPTMAGAAARPNTAASGTAAVSSILQSGNITTGVRGADNGNVVLTGSAVIEGSAATDPFLYSGSLADAPGATVSRLKPPFAGETTATFYGPDTDRFNPDLIPRGQVRAVGSYQSSSAPTGVINQGMIYLGPVGGRGGSWTSMNVPADGRHTAGNVRACPRVQTGCFVMDTIPHSTMGDLVVGNYDLNPSVPGGLISANGFIYNMTTHQWTLLGLGGSLSTQTTLYGIWQDGGAGSPIYTLAGGSAAGGGKRGLLINYNEQTGTFGQPHYYSYGNDRTVVTHFEGITEVLGGFHLVALSTAQNHVSMASVPAIGFFDLFGRARWHPVDVASSPVCPGGCTVTTGNTVYRNKIMGLYLQKGSSAAHTYLAAVRP